jgi:hypothetical protein
VAGTRPRGVSSTDDEGLRDELMHSEKDLSEHAFVRIGIEEALGPLCEEIEVEGGVSEMKLARGRHLRSRVSGTLREGVTDAALLDALHPTPGRGRASEGGGARGDSGARTVRPGPLRRPYRLDRGRRLRVRRRHPLGLVRGRTLALFSGAGIVAGSVPDEEWAEIEQKIGDFTRMFGLDRDETDASAPAGALANRLWARLIVEELVRCGVDSFCVAPGSRSTPLVAALAENERARKLVHYDERGTAFAALGYARATGRPAAWITTSGTAVANGLPAVVEAATDGVPMILLTADRPPELRQTGANQTIDQPDIFGDFVRWRFDLPAPSLKIDPAMVLTTLDQAAYRAVRAPQGPVHLNLMFREPFLPDTEDGEESSYRPPGSKAAGPTPATPPPDRR